MSDNITSHPNAILYDGQTPIQKEIYVRVEQNYIIINETKTNQTHKWNLQNIKIIPYPKDSNGKIKYTLTDNKNNNAQIVTEDENLLKHIRQTHAFKKKTKQKYHITFGILVAAILIVIAGAYAVKSRMILAIVPFVYWQNIADNVETILFLTHQQCKEPDGKASLQRIVGEIKKKYQIPDFEIKIYKSPIINAFALPAKRIIFTSALIEFITEQSQLKNLKPHEIFTAILAHEIGHINEKDSEVALIRYFGYTLILDILTAGQIPAHIDLVIILNHFRYSRQAEKKADIYAVKLMGENNIEPKNLAAFLDAIEKYYANNKEKKYTQSKMLSFLSTHPPTQERIQTIQKNGYQKKKNENDFLPNLKWENIKNICAH